MSPAPLPSAPPEPEQPQQRQASFIQVMAAVFSSFLGIRKKAAGERDLVTIKLPHVIIAGLIGAAIFVAVLVTLVRFITRHG